MTGKNIFGSLRAPLLTATALLTLLAVAFLISPPHPPEVEAQESTPGAPASVSLSRADGTVTASWPAVSGATKYHATYSADGGSSWHAPVNNHTNIPTNSITFDADNSKSYIVGVRAGNDSDQWSGWRNSPSAGPFTPNPAPGPVSSVTITRTDGNLNANWPAVNGATKYHITYTVNGSGNWMLAALNHAASSIDISGVDNAKTYIVGVRAGNSTGWSGWVNSPAAGPYTPPQPTPTPAPEPTPTPTPQPPPAAPTGLTATAGDQSVALAWNASADSSITGYEYRTRYAGVAWGDWTAISATNSYTVTGLENGKEYRFKLRAVNAGGASKPGPQSSPWYVSATPAPPPPPVAPSNVAVNPGNGSLSITWDAVSEATSYEVRAKAEGATEWHDVASGVTGTSYTYTTSNIMDYVGVRARNANGASAWSDVSRMPSNDLLNVATGLSSGGASAQSVQAQSQLAAPTWGTITRKAVELSRGNLATELDLNWTGVSGATGYSLACSDVGGWEWYICGWVDATNSNTVTYTSVPSAQSQPVTVSHYRRTSENQQPAGDYRLTYQRPLMVSIRAVNANPADASAWTTTPTIRIILPNLRDFTVTRTDGQIAMSWKPNKWTTGYEVYCDNYTAGQTASYTLCATLTNQDDTAASHSVTITKSGGTHNWSALDDTSTLDIAIDSTNAYNKERFLAPFIYPVVKLSVSNIGLTTATLTIANHSENWYYKYTSPDGGTCSSAQSGTTADVSGLTGGMTYTFKAYSDSTCSTLLATADFTTVSYVTTLTSTKANWGNHISTSADQAIAFTTGDYSNGYTLKNVIVPLRKVNEPSAGTNGLQLKLHELKDKTSAYSSSSVPSDAALRYTTFSKTSTPSIGTSWTDTTYTCSGVGCSLSANTTYFIVATFDGSQRYEIAYATSEVQTTKPDNSGWDIEYGHNKTTINGSWTSYSDFTLARFEFTYAPTLASSNVRSTGATLTLSHYHDGDWYYKADKDPHSTCQGPVSGARVTLTGLSVGESYTYGAYSDTSCSTLLAMAAEFTTSSYVTNLASARQESIRLISRDERVAVAFTTGANTNGYTLKNIIATLKSKSASGGTNGLELKLHTMVGSTYSSTSAPSATAVANATFSGTAPTGSAWADTRYTCSGAGCSLSANTTYFIVATFDGGVGGYTWAYTNAQTQTTEPANSGWDIKHGHYKDDGNTPRAWTSYGGEHLLSRLEFTTTP